VTNCGTQNLTLTNIIETGPDAGQFAPFGDPGSSGCQAGASLAPGGQCLAMFTFTPNADRTFNAQMDFYDNSGGASNAEQIVTLTGVGIPPAPIVSLTVPSLVFGTQNVGSRSGAQNVTLANLGSATLRIASVTLTGTNASDFVIPTAGTTCPVSGGTVIVRANCTVAIQLAPQTPGAKNASLTFTDNAPGSPPASVTLWNSCGSTISAGVPSEPDIHRAEREHHQPAAERYDFEYRWRTCGGYGDCGFRAEQNRFFRSSFMHTKSRATWNAVPNWCDIHAGSHDTRNSDSHPQRAHG
jgi:hypothetical protein